jgi:hypothetical protein
VPGAGIQFTPAQLAELRELLGLPAGASERVVEAGVMLALGVADGLIAEVEQVLAAEWQYLEFAAPLGWLDEP